MTVLTGLPDRRLVLTGLAVDDSEERWITVNGGEGDGQAVMIGRNPSGSGWVIKGGAGGALNGTVVHPKSMSGPKGGSPTPSPSPAPAPAKPAETASAKAHRLSAVANNGEKRTHMEKADAHRAAYQAHAEARDLHSTEQYDLAGKGDKEGATAANAKYREHTTLFYEHQSAAFKAREAHFRAEKREAKKALVESISQTDEGKAVAAREKRFEKGSSVEIGQHLKERFGLNLHNGSNALREYKAAHAAFYKSYGKLSPEEREAGRDRLAALAGNARATNSYRIGAHTEYDIDDNSPQAKEARKVMGHVYQALEHLESQGFNVKAALSNAQVAYAPGNVGKSLGHAFQRNGTGYFTLSAGKNSLAYRAERVAQAAKREEAGKPRWTVSSGSGIEGDQRATAIHELAHALGLQPHIDSPGKLQSLLQEHVSTDYKARREWIIKNISEYASENIRETDAELATLVTSPNYVRGTLPKPFEDHVDALFHKKKDA